MSWDWIYSRYTPTIRVAVKISSVEKYVIKINKERINDINLLITYLCEQFGLEFSKEYILIQEPDTIITDPITILNNSELKLMKIKDYSKYKYQERNLHLACYLAKRKLMASKEWRFALFDTLSKLKGIQINTKPKFTVDHLIKYDLTKEFKILNSIEDDDIIEFKPSIFLKKSRVKINKKSVIEWQNGTFDESKTQEKPISLPKFWDNNYSYKQFVVNTLEILTPDFEDFISQIIHAKNYEDLGQIVKILWMLKGFRVIYPRGSKYDDVLYVCHKTGKRKGVKLTKRTGCEFKLVYSRTPDKQGYFLSKYVATHNHHLSIEDIFIGEYAKEKLYYLTNELKKACVDPQRKQKLIQKLNEPVDLREEWNLDKEYVDYQNGLVNLEDLWTLRPVKRWIYNRKVTRIDELWKTLAFQELGKEDVHNIEEEGKLSFESETGVYTNIRSYKYNSKVFNRHLETLKWAQQFELNLLSVLYNQNYDHKLIDDDKKGVESYLSLNSDKIANNKQLKISEIPSISFTNEKTKLKYDKLTQMSIDLSPYRIFEVSDQWNDKSDGDPLKLIEECMPIYNIEIEPPKEKNQKKRERVDVNIENNTNSSFSDMNWPHTNSEINWTQSSSSNSVSIIEQSSEDSKPNDIIDEVANDIKNDIDGVEANHLLKPKRKRDTKEESKKICDQIPCQDDYKLIDQHFSVTEYDNLIEWQNKINHDNSEVLMKNRKNISGW